MLKRLHLRNFTVFEDADFEFGPGLNVIVGANGTGKSHVLKAGYAMLQPFLTMLSDALDGVDSEGGHLGHLKFPNVFQTTTPFSSIDLIRRNGSKQEAEVGITIEYPEGPISTSMFISTKGTSSPINRWPTVFEKKTKFDAPVFIPAKEVLTMGWLLPMYALRQVPIDQTYPDLLRLLSVLPLNAPEPNAFKSLDKLFHIIGGKVEEEGSRFYLSAPDQPRMEMNMVAEGVRKFATLYKLLANGTLTPETTLFWDEPEANLNPALLKEMAAVLTELAKAGFQIILATHSLFLLKEMHILARQEHKPVRYFGLSAEPGGPTTVATADNLELLPDIVALDAELEQSDRFQRVLDQEDADHN